VVDVTPPPGPPGTAAFNVRTRVHEYGGGAWLVDGGTVCFANDAGQRPYCQAPGAAPVPVTPEPPRPRELHYATGDRPFDGPRRLFCSYVEDGFHRLATVDLASLAGTPLDQPYQDAASVRAAAGVVDFRGGTPESPPEFVAVTRRRAGRACSGCRRRKMSRHTAASSRCRKRSPSTPTPRQGLRLALLADADFVRPAAEVPP
jgi:hypothetical protein